MNFQQYLIEASKLFGKDFLCEKETINKIYLSKLSGSEESYKEIKSKVDKLWNDNHMSTYIKKSDMILPFLYSQEIKKKGSVTDKTMKFLHDLSLVNKTNILDKLDSDTTPEQFKEFIEKSTKDHLENLSGLTKDEETIWKRVKVFHKFDDGFEWVNALDSEGNICSHIPSNITFKTAGHCGNEPSKQKGDQYFELRKNNKPYLTVIINDGKIEESKSYGNQRNKDTDLILNHYKWLLSHEHVTGVGRRYNFGYAPHANIGLKDFLGKDDEFIKHIEKTKPDLMGKTDKVIIDLKKQLQAGNITEEDVIKLFKNKKIKLWELIGILGKMPFSEKELIEMINKKNISDVDIINTDTKLLTIPMQHAIVDNGFIKNLILVHNEVPSAKIDMNYIFKIAPSALRYIPKDKIMSTIEEFKESFKEGFKKDVYALGYIPEDKRMSIVEMFKDSFAEGFKKDANALKLLPMTMRIKNIKDFGASFGEILKKDIKSIKLVPSKYRMDIIEEFKDIFKEAVKKSPGVVLKSITDDNNKMKVFEMFKDSFKEGFKRYLTTIRYIPGNNRMKVFEEFKDIFKEGFKKDLSAIQYIPKDKILEVIKMFENSFKEKFKKKPTTLHLITDAYKMDVLKMFKDSFKEEFEKNPTTLYLIQDADKMAVLKMFKDSFKEGFKHDINVISHIPDDMIPEVIDMFKDSFKEGFERNMDKLWAIPKDKLNIVKKILGL